MATQTNGGDIAWQDQIDRQKAGTRSFSTDMSNGGKILAGGLKKHVFDNDLFKIAFDPLGIVSAASAKFAPDQFSADQINYGDYEDKATSNKLNQLQEFYKHLNGPLDMNDPEVRMITQNANNATMRQSANQGVRGGLSVGNTQRNVANAQTGLSGQRQQMYAQGMTQLAGLQQQASDSQYRRYQDALGAENGKAAAMRAEYQQKNAGIEGLAGGIIGGVFGKPEIGQAIGNVGGGQSVGPTQYAKTTY